MKVIGVRELTDRINEILRMVAASTPCLHLRTTSLYFIATTATPLMRYDIIVPYTNSQMTRTIDRCRTIRPHNKKI